VPVVKLSALGRLNGEAKWEKQIDELHEGGDEYIPQPARESGQAVSDADRDIFSISGRGTVVTGRIERGKTKVGEEVEIVGFPRHAQDGGDGNRNVQKGRWMKDWRATTPDCCCAA